MKRPGRIASFFTAVNGICWLGLFWFAQIPHAKESLDAGLWIYLTAILFLGPGILIYIPIAASINGINGVMGAPPPSLGLTTFLCIMAAVGLISWSTFGYAIGIWIDRRERRKVA